MKVSIIIPVYRTESTLARCINSVLAQTYTCWEMILIDDGSDDNSPQICDDFVDKDKRIKVIHQPNKGLGAARNTGIEHANGNFLLFIDSDDYIKPNTIEIALNELQKYKQCAFAEFGIHKWVGNAKQETTLAFEHRVIYSAEEYWFSAKGYEHCYAWNKLFRREVFEHIKFQENKKFEDVFTMINVLNEYGQCVLISPVLYYYCYNNNSITAKAKTELCDLLEALVLVFERLKWKRPHNTSHADYALFCKHALNVQIDVYTRCGKDKILLHTLPLALTPKIIAQRILGISLFCKTYNLLRKLCKNIHH